MRERKEKERKRKDEVEKERNIYSREIAGGVKRMEKENEKDKKKWNERKENEKKEQGTNGRKM